MLGDAKLIYLGALLFSEHRVHNKNIFGCLIKFQAVCAFCHLKKGVFPVYFIVVEQYIGLGLCNSDKFSHKYLENLKKRECSPIYRVALILICLSMTIITEKLVVTNIRYSFEENYYTCHEHKIENNIHGTMKYNLRSKYLE